MRNIKKFVAAGSVALVLAAGVATPASAAPKTFAKPQAASLCDLFRWLPWCP